MTTPRLLPSEQRVVDALTARGVTLGDRIGREILEAVGGELGCSWSTAQNHVAAVRRQLREAGVTPDPTPRGGLTKRQEQAVDELEALGYAVTQRISEDVLETLAERLDSTPVAMQRLVMKIRARWGVRMNGGLTPQPEYLVTGLLPEAPTLPLECVDPAVVARCQREGRALGERGRAWRGW